MERSTQTAESLLTKSLKARKDPYLALLEYRNMPVDNYASPAQLLMPRNIRSIVPVTRNNLQAKLVDVAQFREKRLQEQQNQKRNYDIRTKQLSELQEVVRLREGKEWRPDVVLKKAIQPRSYIVKLESGEIIRRDRFQLMSSATELVLDNRNVEIGPTSKSNRTLADN